MEKLNKRLLLQTWFKFPIIILHENLKFEQLFCAQIIHVSFNKPFIAGDFDGSENDFDGNDPSYDDSTDPKPYGRRHWERSEKPIMKFKEEKVIFYVSGILCILCLAQNFIKFGAIGTKI